MSKVLKCYSPPSGDDLIFNGHLHPSDFEALCVLQKSALPTHVLKESRILSATTDPQIVDNWWQNNVNSWQKYVRAIQHSEFYSWPLQIAQASWRLCQCISLLEYEYILYLLRFGDESLILDLAHKLRDAGIPEARHLLSREQAEWVLTTLALEVQDSSLRLSLTPTLYGSGYVMPLRLDRFILMQGDRLILAKDPQGAQIVAQSSLGFHRGLSLGVSFPERYVRYRIIYTYLIEACGNDAECRRLLMTNIWPCYQMCAYLCGDICESGRIADDYTKFQKFVERSLSITTDTYPAAETDIFATIRVSTGSMNECFGVLRTNAVNWVECVSDIKVPSSLANTKRSWDRCVKVYMIPNMFMNYIDRFYLLERSAILALNISGIILTSNQARGDGEEFLTHLERMTRDELICLNDVSHMVMKYRPAQINYTSHTLADLECALLSIVRLQQQRQI